MRYGDSVSLSRIRNPRQTPVFKSVQEYQKSIWPSEIEVSIGSSLKKAKGEKEEKKKLFMAFRGKAKKLQ